MGRLHEGVSSGLQVVQAYADTRDGNTKRTTLLVLTSVIFVLPPPPTTRFGT